jgi:hypothetical protein
LETRIGISLGICREGTAFRRIRSLHRAWTTKLVTGAFGGYKSDPFENLSHRDHGTNGLEINAGHGLPLLEPFASFHLIRVSESAAQRSGNRTWLCDSWKMQHFAEP